MTSFTTDWKESGRVHRQAKRGSGIEAFWRGWPGRLSLNLNVSTLPWGWICVCRRCRCDSPSCGGPTTSSDDAVDAGPCCRDQDYRPRSRCSSDGRHRRCCSSGPPPADFYAHTHTTTFHARLLLRAYTRVHERPSTTDTHTRAAMSYSEPLSELSYPSSRIESSEKCIFLFCIFFSKRGTYIFFRFSNILGWLRVFFLCSVNFSAISSITDRYYW